MKKLAKSFVHAGAGVRYALRGRNFRVALFCGIVTLVAAWFVRLTGTELAIVILTVGFVLAMEATNTAVEEICNKFHPETHPHIALIKDLAAGAALISVIAAAAVGLAVFIPYFLR